MKSFIYMAMSANGLIATDQGETPWGKESWDNFKNAVQSTGNIILGRTTYEIMLKDDTFSIWSQMPRVVVVASKPITPGGERVTQVQNPGQAIKMLQAENFDDILIGGGPMLALSMIEENWVDELWLDVEPIFIGSGIGLVKAPLQRKLTLISSDAYGQGGVTLKYAVTKGIHD